MTENQLAGAVLAGIGAIFAWVLRTLLTNNKKLALLEQALALRTAQQLKTETHLVDAIKELTTQVHSVNLKLAQLEGMQDAKGRRQ